MSTNQPAGLRLASTCSAVGGILLFLFSFSMIVGGAFVGLHVFGPGVLTFGLGILGMSASKRIDERRPLSRTIGLVWGGTVAACVTAMMFASLRAPDSDLTVAIIFNATFGALAICVIVPLLLPSTSRWLALTNERANSDDGGGAWD